MTQSLKRHVLIQFVWYVWYGVSRSRGDTPDKALSLGVVFGLGAVSGAVSAVSSAAAGCLDTPAQDVMDYIGIFGRSADLIGKPLREPSV